MSKKAAKAYLERIRADAEFRNKVMAIKEDEERMALIRAEGFNCSADEINAAELQTSDMDKICGGQSSFGETSFIFGAIKSLFKK